MTLAQACNSRVGPMHFWVQSVNLSQLLLCQHSDEHLLCQPCWHCSGLGSWLPAHFGESVGDFLQLEEVELEEGNLAPLKTLPFVLP